MTTTPNPPVEQKDDLVEVLAELLRLATPLPWDWYNGNSWWRIATVESSGCKTVVCPVTDRSDGHPNLAVTDADRQLIIAALNAVPDLLTRIQSDAARIKRLEEAEGLLREQTKLVDQVLSAWERGDRAIGTLPMLGTLNEAIASYLGRVGSAEREAVAETGSPPEFLA